MANFVKKSGAGGEYSQSANSLKLRSGQKSQIILWGGGPDGAPLFVMTEPPGRLQLKENRTTRRGAHERVFDIVGIEAGETAIRAVVSAADPRDYTPPLQIIVAAAKTPAVASSGELRLVRTEPLAPRNVWSPIEQSLASEMVFKWGGVRGGGKIYYFDLDEVVVPNKFGVLVPDGVTDFRNVHLFFHPTPAQKNNPYHDSGYFNNPIWRNIFHYLTGEMAVQFCAANSNQVLFMPLMSNGAAATCGMLPARWESLMSKALGMIAGVAPVAISTLVVSSFSSGITYSAAFRKQAIVGGRLRGVIDFDGIISTHKRHSQAIGAPNVRMWQTDVAAAQIIPQSAMNFFQLPLKRWDIAGSGPYKFKGDIMQQIHGAIPNSMMYVAARRTKV